jgi:hypothetical protein
MPFTQGNGIKELRCRPQLLTASKFAQLWRPGGGKVHATRHCCPTGVVASWHRGTVADRLILAAAACRERNRPAGVW